LQHLTDEVDESINARFEAEVIHHGGSRKRLEAVECATFK
jgi:hypothetical protein